MVKQIMTTIARDYVCTYNVLHVHEQTRNRPTSSDIVRHRLIIHQAQKVIFIGKDIPKSW